MKTDKIAGKKRHRDPVPLDMVKNHYSVQKFRTFSETFRPAK